MKGTIHIITPVINHSLPLVEGTQAEMYEKSRVLKELVCLQSYVPFIVYAEMQSRMNSPGFDPGED
jgi:hypothetical protein